MFACVLAGGVAKASAPDCLDLYLAIQNANALVNSDLQEIAQLQAQLQADLNAGDYHGAQAVAGQLSGAQQRINADQNSLDSFVAAYNAAGC